MSPICRMEDHKRFSGFQHIVLVSKHTFSLFHEAANNFLNTG